MKKAKWEADGMERQETRVLIVNHEASVIIGKGGANVKQLRADSNAFVSVLKNESGSTERVLQVRGSVECNASALKMIAELLLRNDTERNADSGAEPKTTWVFKLLIHKALAGAVIGKGGEIIRNMQTETNTKISVSTEPIGASTEKTVTITGTPAQLHDVITRILTQICENPIKAGSQSMLYVPGQSMAFAPPNPYGAPQGYGMPGPYGMPPANNAPYGAPMGGMGMGGGGGMGGGAPQQGQKTQKIVIPSACAGTVIGKGGSIIREIKNQSGCNISLAAPEPPGSDDRVVTITGSEQGIQAAIYQIRQRVESYTPPAGGTPGY